MTPRPLLDAIHGPADLRKLPPAALPALAAEIRAELIEVISRHGGHLASNLGAVELTIALLRTFDPVSDTIVWDTGHQGYVYKLLTGRRELFQKLRQGDGCCGFPNRQENPADAFGVGHAGTAISAALGFAAARDRTGGKSRVLAVVGDGSLGCGVSLEGLNNVIETTRDFILVVNDNKMAIAPNAGGIARHLNRIISGERYNRIKARLRDRLTRIPKIGAPLRQLIHRLEEATKSILVPGVFFEQLGLRYIGPINGHDLDELVETFEAVGRLREPLVIHVLTAKGQGYPHAEQAPEEFHGLSAFDPESGQPLHGATTSEAGPTFSQALGDILCRRVERDPRVLAITAGMCHGTGLRHLREKHPERLRDVGIAEEHAVVFAAGLAAAGQRPVVAIYATFMHRAFDYVFHDVCLQNLPVLFCLDRAGIVEDGPTHHGIHDFGFWRTVPNLTVAQPADAWELEEMLSLLQQAGTPAVIRYPKGSAAPLPVPQRTPLQLGQAEVLRNGPHVAIWAVGRETVTALHAADLLAKHGIDATVVNPRFLIPFDRDLLLRHAAVMPVVTIENHVTTGGFASLADEVLAGQPCVGLCHCGWPLEVLPWGAEAEIRRRYRMDVESIAADIRELLRR